MENIKMVNDIEIDTAIVPQNKPCQKSRIIFSVVRIEKGTDLVRI